MSELLLLAAGLLSRASAGQPPTGPLLPVLPPPADAATQPEAESVAIPAIASTEQSVQLEFSGDRPAAKPQSRWTGRRRSLRRGSSPPMAIAPASDPLISRTSAASALVSRSMSRLPRLQRAEAAEIPPNRPSQNVAQPVNSVATPVRLSEPIAAAPSPAPPLLLAPTTPPSSIRPQSGAQQYQQRWAALQLGLTYTRMAADSFHPQWATATQQPTYEQWVSLLGNEARAMAAGQGSNRLSVLVGDSISQWFPVEQLSRDRFWLNQGISGDTSAGVLRRLSLFQNTRPTEIHLMVGINDLRRGASNADLLSNLSQIMQQLRQDHPQAQILVYSILPTRLPALPPERIYDINQNLEAIARQQKVAYVDLQRFFAEETSGILRHDLTTDGIHLSRQGYALWQWAIGYLTQPPQAIALDRQG